MCSFPDDIKRATQHHLASEKNLCKPINHRLFPFCEGKFAVRFFEGIVIPNESSFSTKILFVLLQMIAINIF